MRTLFIAASMLLATSAVASTYSYTCVDQGRSYALEVDDTKNTLLWKGRMFKLTPHEPGEVCAKFGWHVQGNGIAFDFCTATQGYAGFERDGESMGIECDQTRFNGKATRSLRPQYR